MMQDLGSGTQVYVGKIEQDVDYPPAVFIWKLEVVTGALTSQLATVSLVEDCGT